ncbi:NACHT domain-containing protein, partial [Erwinia sp.]|uniref:NACHT domain-containing protein n=1 Tax=Erwinia citreus TaxID=558 RepID=UPI002899428C
MAVLTTAITTKVISDLLVKTGSKTFNTASTFIKSKKNIRDLYQSVCDSNYNEDYAKNVINKVFTFRTIINGDRDVYLDQIYHPLKLTSPNDEIHEVNDDFSLPEHMSSCLVGYAGQGKTITMKKMFLEDLNKNHFFPFFISLRTIDFSKDISLPSVLLQHFKTHGVQSDIESINSLLKKMEHVRIYFDGFDEIHHNHRDNALALLDDCISIWKVNVICSSRPDTQICRQPGFIVYSVNFLEADDVEAIVNINVHNSDTKNTLLNILHGKDFLLESIKSPILVDIFIVTSTGLGKKPENIVNYYESLFSSLVYKHDFNKIFTRARKSDLTDTQMELCLSYFAFISQLKQETNFAYSDLIEAFNDAKSIIGKEDEDERKIIEDVMEITNLITRDGYDNYTFIHKSIQDFYAAKFISSSTEDNQIVFFKEINRLRPDLNFCYMLKSLIP